MKLSNREIIGAVNALDEISAEKLPVKVSMDLAQMAIKLAEPGKAFESVRDSLRKTYDISQEEKDGNVIIKSGLDKKDSKGEQLQKFLDEIKELLNLETEVVIKVINLPEKIAGTCDKCNHNIDVPLQLTQGTMIALAKLVTV